MASINWLAFARSSSCTRSAVDLFLGFSGSGLGVETRPHSRQDEVAGSRVLRGQSAQRCGWSDGADRRPEDDGSVAQASRSRLTPSEVSTTDISERGVGFDDCV